MQEKSEDIETKSWGEGEPWVPCGDADWVTLRRNLPTGTSGSEEKPGVAELLANEHRASRRDIGRPHESRTNQRESI